MQFNWPAPALRAQALAARSFAEATIRDRADWTDAQRLDALDCRCDLARTIVDQTWAGATTS